MTDIQPDDICSHASKPQISNSLGRERLTDICAGACSELAAQCEAVTVSAASDTYDESASALQSSNARHEPQSEVLLSHAEDMIDIPTEGVEKARVNREIREVEADAGPSMDDQLIPVIQTLRQSLLELIRRVRKLAKPTSQSGSESASQLENARALAKFFGLEEPQRGDTGVPNTDTTESSPSSSSPSLSGTNSSSESSSKSASTGSSPPPEAMPYCTPNDEIERAVVKNARDAVKRERILYKIQCCHLIAKALDHAGHAASASSQALFSTSRDVSALAAYILTNPTLLVEFVQLLRLVGEPSSDQGFVNDDALAFLLSEDESSRTQLGRSPSHTDWDMITSGSAGDDTQLFPGRLVVSRARPTQSAVDAVASALDIALYEPGANSDVPLSDSQILAELVYQLPRPAVLRHLVHPHGLVKLPFSTQPNDPDGPIEFRIPSADYTPQKLALELESLWISPANPIFLRWLALKQVQMAFDTLGLGGSLEDVFEDSNDAVLKRTISELFSADSPLEPMFLRFRRRPASQVGSVLPLWPSGNADAQSAQPLDEKWSLAFCQDDYQLENECIDALCASSPFDDCTGVDAKARQAFTEAVDEQSKDDDQGSGHSRDLSASSAVPEGSSGCPQDQDASGIQAQNNFVSGLLYGFPSNALVLPISGPAQSTTSLSRTIPTSTSTQNLQKAFDLILQFATPGQSIRFLSAFMANFRSSISPFELLHSLIYLYLFPSPEFYLNSYLPILKLRAIRPKKAGHFCDKRRISTPPTIGSLPQSQPQSQPDPLDDASSQPAALQSVEMFSLVRLFRANIIGIIVGWIGSEYASDWTPAMLVLATQFLQHLPKDDALTQILALSLLRLRQYLDSSRLAIQAANDGRDSTLEAFKSKLIEEEALERAALRDAYDQTKAKLLQTPRGNPDRLALLDTVTRLERQMEGLVHSSKECSPFTDPFTRGSVRYLHYLSSSLSMLAPGTSLGSLVLSNLPGGAITTIPTTFFQLDHAPLPIPVEPVPAQAVLSRMSSVSPYSEPSRLSKTDSALGFPGVERKLSSSTFSLDPETPGILSSATYAGSLADPLVFPPRQSTNAADSSRNSKERRAYEHLARVSAHALTLLKYRDSGACAAKLAYGFASVSAATALAQANQAAAGPSRPILVSAHGASFPLIPIPGLVFSAHPFSAPSPLQICKLALSLSRRLICQLQITREDSAVVDVSGEFAAWDSPVGVFLSLPDSSLCNQVDRLFKCAMETTDQFNIFLKTKLRTQFPPLPLPQPPPPLHELLSGASSRTEVETKVHPSMILGPAPRPPIPSFPHLTQTLPPLDLDKAYYWQDYKHVAEQLTYLSYSLYCTITPNDIIRFRSQPIDPFNRTALMVRHFNQISFWAATELLALDHPIQRAKLATFFLDVATDCLTRLRNFHCAFAIGAALSLQPIYRLKAFKLQLAQDDAQKMKALADLTAGYDNFAGYRRLLEQARNDRLPAVPHLAVLLKDLTLASEPSRAEIMTGQINANRWYQVSSEIIRFLSFQQTPYRFVSAVQQGHRTSDTTKSRRTLSDASHRTLASFSRGSDTEPNSSSLVRVPSVASDVSAYVTPTGSSRDIFLPPSPRVASLTEPNLSPTMFFLTQGSRSPTSSRVRSATGHTNAPLTGSFGSTQNGPEHLITLDDFRAVLSRTRFGALPLLLPFVPSAVAVAATKEAGQAAESDGETSDDEDEDEDEDEDDGMLIKPSSSDETDTVHEQFPVLPPLPSILDPTSQQYQDHSLIVARQLAIPTPLSDLRLPSPRLSAESLYVNMFAPPWPNWRSSLSCSMAYLGDHTAAHATFAYLSQCAEALENWLESEAESQASEKSARKRRQFKSGGVAPVRVGSLKHYREVSPLIPPAAVAHLRKMASATLFYDPWPRQCFRGFTNNNLRSIVSAGITRLVLEHSHLYTWQRRQILKAKDLLWDKHQAALARKLEETSTSPLATAVPQTPSQRSANSASCALDVSRQDGATEPDINLAATTPDKDGGGLASLLSEKANVTAPRKDIAAGVPGHRHSQSTFQGLLPQQSDTNVFSFASVPPSSSTLNLLSPGLGVVPERVVNCDAQRCAETKYDTLDIPSLRLIPDLLRELMARISVAIGPEELQQKSLELEPKMTDRDYLDILALSTLVEDGSL